MSPRRTPRVTTEDAGDGKRVIAYDLTGVRPFPLKDPEIDEMEKGKRRGRAKPRVELPGELERFRFYSVDELGAFPPVAWLIEEYLAVGELTVFYGRGDTYKSFLALDWSCLLASTGHVVIYVVAEGASGMRARIAAWMKHHGVKELPTLLLMPSNVNLHRPSEVEDWLKAAEVQLGGRQPALVVVDTLARNFVGGNENNAQDMGLFVDGLERIRRELLTAVLVLHHATKDDKAERGTESLRNASFAMFKFKGRNDLAVDVECDRMKDAERPTRRRLVPTKVPLPELGVGVASLVAGWEAIRGAKGEERRESGREFSRREIAILRALDGAKEGAKRGDLERLLNLSPSQVRRYLKPLLEEGFIATEGQTRDRSYALTESGKALLP